MNSQTPIDNNQSANLYRHADRSQRREERRAARASLGSSTWIAGVILVILGAFFLLQNTGTVLFPSENWGALFILIPAFGAFDRAIRLYRASGDRWIMKARSALMIGLGLLVLTGILLFEVDMTIVGPALLVLVGLAVLINAMLHDSD